MRISTSRYVKAGALLAIGLLFTAIHFVRSNSIENRIIRAIDKQCESEGECIISLPEITDFDWDFVSIFVTGGDSYALKNELGIGDRSIDFQDGIVFSHRGRVVKVHTSSYDYNREMQPRLGYGIVHELGRPQSTRKKYPYNSAFLKAQKIRQGDGFRYMLYG